MKFEPMLSVLVYSACLCCELAQANTDGTVFLERGRRGIVPCPPIASRRVTLEETDAVYWYHRQRDRRSLLISYFRGNVAPQNGIPAGVYDINSEFSLVIENVTASDEGLYICLVKPKWKMTEDGYVEVLEKVSPNRLFHNVIGCDQSFSGPGQCNVPIEYDTPMRSLTCLADSVKPAVQLRWFRILADGSEELVDASQTIRTVVLPPNKGSALRNHTFSTSSSIQLTSVKDDVKYRCEAHGVAVGNGSHVIISFVRAPSTRMTVTYSEPNPAETAGTMPALTEETSAITIALAVVASISLSVNFIAISLYMVSRRKKRRPDTNTASEITTCKPVQTTNGNAVELY